MLRREGERCLRPLAHEAGISGWLGMPRGNPELARRVASAVRRGLRVLGWVCCNSGVRTQGRQVGQSARRRRAAACAAGHLYRLLQGFGTSDALLSTPRIKP